MYKQEASNVEYVLHSIGIVQERTCINKKLGRGQTFTVIFEYVHVHVRETSTIPNLCKFKRYKPIL